MQTDVKKIKNSIEKIHNSINPCKVRRSERQGCSWDYGMKEYLNTTKEHKKSIQQLLGNSKKNNMRFVRITEKSEHNINELIT